MATIDSKEMVDRLIAGGGWLPPEQGEDPEDSGGDAQAHSIVEYTNIAGNLAYGVSFVGDPKPSRYLIESAFVRNPRLIWSAEKGKVDGK